MSVQGLTEEIEKRRVAELERKISPYHRRQPIASDCDPGECIRRQVLELTAPQEKPLHDAELQARFDTGNLWEREGVRMLLGLGFDIVEAQIPFELTDRHGDDVVLRGKIDGKVAWEPQPIPFEIKSLHPNVYNRVHEWKDFLRMDFFKKYPSQLQSYLIGHGCQEGFFYVTDCLGHWKAIPMELDYEWAERIWRRAEEVVDWAKHDELPDYSTNPAECRRCWAFGRVCNPPTQDGEGIEILVDEELEQALIRRQELEASHQEFQALDKRVKGAVKDRYHHALCGDFEITVDTHARRKVVLPDDVKQKYTVMGEAQRVTIRPVESGAHD